MSRFKNRFGNRFGDRVEDRLDNQGGFSPASISGLTAWYKFDGNANDSAFGNNGTATNVTYDTGKSGQCGVFNGTAKVAVAHNVNIDDWTNLSVHFLMKANLAAQAGKQYTRVIEKGFNNEYSIVMNTDVAGSGRISMQKIFGNNILLTTTNTVADDAWHMVTFTVNSNYTEGKVYIDGVFDTSAALTGGTPGDPAKQHGLTIGSEAAGTTYAYVGCLDGVSLYNKVLSQAEITQLKNYYGL